MTITLIKQILSVRERMRDLTLTTETKEKMVCFAIVSALLIGTPFVTGSQWWHDTTKCYMYSSRTENCVDVRARTNSTLAMSTMASIHAGR